MDRSEQGGEALKITVEKMVQEAARELEAVRHPGAKEAARNLVKKALGRPVSGKDPIFWPAGLLMLGLLEAGHEETVRRYLDEWIRDGMPVRHPDDALTGEVLLRLYEERAGERSGEEESKSCSGFQTGRERKEQTGQDGKGSGAGQDRENRKGREDRECSRSVYKEAADHILTYLRSCRLDCCGSIVYGQGSSNDYIFADGVGQIVLFLSHYGKLFDDENGRYARKQAEKELTNFLQHGMDKRSGLPYHGYDAATGMKCGIIGWGRAVGWLLMGMAEYCSALPEDYCNGASPEHGDVPSDSVKDSRRDTLQKLIDACMERVRPDGLFSWQLDCVDGPADTSATGMIDWAMLQMHLQQPGAAAETLLQHVDADGRVGQASAECIDFGEYRQIYGNYPWGQGAALMFLAAWEKIL